MFALSVARQRAAWRTAAMPPGGRDDSLEAPQDTGGGMNVSLAALALRTCTHVRPPVAFAGARARATGARRGGLGPGRLYRLVFQICVRIYQIMILLVLTGHWCRLVTV